MAESNTPLQLLRERWLSVMLGATLMPAIQDIVALVWSYLFRLLPLRAISAGHCQVLIRSCNSNGLSKTVGSSAFPHQRVEVTE